MLSFDKSEGGIREFLICCKIPDKVLDNVEVHLSALGIEKIDDLCELVLKDLEDVGKNVHDHSAVYRFSVLPGAPGALVTT